MEPPILSIVRDPAADPATRRPLVVPPDPAPLRWIFPSSEERTDRAS